MKKEERKKISGAMVMAIAAIEKEDYELAKIQIENILKEINDE